MIEPYHSIILIFLAGYFDFSRGGHGQWTRKIIPFVSHKHIFLLLLASLYVYVIGFTYWSLIFVIWFTLAGVMFGTGDPIGKIVGGHSEHGNDNNKAGKWEKWQYIVKTDNAFTNHAILGALWALPTLFLGFFLDINWLGVFIGHVVGFYFMGFAVRGLEKDVRWQHLEKLRSACAMLITITWTNFV
jgi:hypothetical protein